MKLKKFLTLSLCFFMLFSTACGNSDSPSDPDKVEPKDGINYDKQIGELCADGMAKYEIIIPNDAGDAVINAADELIEYVKESAGVEIKIRKERESNFLLPFVSLGNTSKLQEKNFDINYSDLGSDGFIIKTSDNNVFITGKTERGVLYGTYDFIEKFIGVRWFAHDCTYVPKKDSIALYETDLKEVPAFANRAYLSNQLMWNQQFAAHMRMNDEYLSMPEKFGGEINLGVLEDAVHNSLYYVFGYNRDKSLSDDPYMFDNIYKDHPEWFYVNKNKTHVENDQIYDLCYSHVGLTEDGEIDQSLEISPVKLVIERMKEFILRDSDKTYFMIGQEDYTETCQCEKCINQEEKYKRSGMLVRFVNAVAKEIETWAAAEGLNREIKICTFAYYYSQPAPLNKAKEPLDQSVIPAKNVYIRLAPITADNYYGIADPNQANDVRTMFADWSKITDRFMIWSYHTAYGGYFVYYPTMQHWKEDLCLYATMDMAYVLMQSAYQTNALWINHMETYVASKMLWNPNQDVTKLKNEFIEFYYKGFSEYINEFIDNMDEKYALNMAGVGIPESLRPRSQIGSMGSLLDSQLYSVTFWERQFEILEQADKRIDELDISDTEKSVYHNRVAMIRLTPQYMVAVRYDYYYPDDVFGKNNFLKEFFDNCKAVNANYWKENGQIDSLKAQLGYNG